MEACLLSEPPQRQICVYLRTNSTSTTSTSSPSLPASRPLQSDTRATVVRRMVAELSHRHHRSPVVLHR
ncbi:hypothetical protein Hanom_Chr17g01564971 [Helianthus anomalus]